MANKNINIELEEAVCHDDLEKVRTLLSAGANPNFEPPCDYDSFFEHGGTLLHYVRSAEIANELLINGADVNSRNMYGEKLLFTSVKYCTGRKMLVRELLKHGADVNETHTNGDTALNIAVKKGCIDLEVIRVLLEYGADINIRNCNHGAFENCCTPLDNAINNPIRYPECAELLIKITLIKNFDNNYRKIINLDPYQDYGVYSRLSSYLDDCVCEITKMKTCSIGKSLSLYELITLSKVAIYQDDKVFELLTADNYPIYHDIISSKISASLERATLLNKLSEVEVYTKLDTSNHSPGVREKIVVLDSYSKLEIAQYLFNDDLQNFIQAFYRHKDQTSCFKRNFTESSTQPNTSLCEASLSNCAKRARLD